MALKLGKCRLCLKLGLGDFYSIFTEDNCLQLAEMVMECTRVKVYEGDGLPDKICSECVQKLSSSFLFKQQCERSDQELRRNYVPPPGFTPSPSNRQSSDSAFSSANTDISNLTKTPTHTTPASRGRKRSRESEDNSSVKSSELSKHCRQSLPKKHRVENIKKCSKTPQQRPESKATTYGDDSDFDDNSQSQYSPDSDSDEPTLQHKCSKCPKEFATRKSLNSHMTWHSRTDKLGENAVVDIPKPLTKAAVNNSGNCFDDDEKLSCERCGKTFKLKIMLKRHLDSCVKQQATSPQKPNVKELLVTLEPINADFNTNPEKKFGCEMCPTRFKTVENLEKHMRICHAAVLKKNIIDRLGSSNPSKTGKVPVPCLFCKKSFDDYYAHSSHFNTCPKKEEPNTYECPVCRRIMLKKTSYFQHLRGMHFEPREELAADGRGLPCKICDKRMASQELLIAHLATHVADNEPIDVEGNSNPSIADGSESNYSETAPSTSTPSLQCKYCDKMFTYKKSLMSHEEKHTEQEKQIKNEPDPAPEEQVDDGRNVSSSFQDDDDDDFVSDESSQDDGGEGNTCDICEKQFSYKRLLIQHKKTKHNMASGTKRASIALKDCKVQCLICEVEMKVSESNAHNQTHIAANIKPRNKYTCTDCGDTFKSCQALGNHIKLVHRLKRQVTKKFLVPDLADFCEVVVTKTEPLDDFQSRNGIGTVPSCNDAKGKPVVDLSGFTCPICSKKMGTLISLKRHVNWHTNVGNNIEQKMECFVCKEKFRFKSHFRLHMKAHYTDTSLDARFLTCDICGRRSKHLRAAQAHNNFHKQTRFQAKDYKCSICKRVLQDRKVYLSHMAIHLKRGESAVNIVVGSASDLSKPTFEGADTCSLCGKVCANQTALKHHVRWHNSKTSLFGSRHECHVCQMQFTNKKSMEVHTRAHYEDDDGPFKCTICGKGFTDEDYFSRHVKGHNFDHQSHKKRIAKLRENKVKCPICERYYPDLVKLIRHLRRTHPQSKMIKEDPDAPPQKVYSCKLCAKVFYEEKRLQRHEESHLRKLTWFKCKFCGKKTVSLKNHNLHIKSHLTTKYIDNPLKCTHCDEYFIRGYDLHHHLRDVHNINETWIADLQQQSLAGPLKELQCAICLKVLASKGNYERHLDYHNSLRCNYCFDYFSSLRFLEGHLSFSCKKKNLIGDTEVHTRKLKCDICYKAFHVQVKLDCHQWTQHGIKVNREAGQGKKETVCDYCFRVFENEAAMNSHKIYHRTIGYYGCLYCDRKFNTITLYNKHKTTHFSQLNVDNPTKCEHCDETFVAFREMIYHMRDEHGDDKEWVVMPKEVTEEECPICRKVFVNLPRHLGYHEANRCKKCGEHFYSRNDFDQHLCVIDSEDEPEIHELDIRPKYEECRFCFKPIGKGSSSKLKHDQIHKGSGSISCRFCRAKFKTMDAFNIHAFSHRSTKYKKKPLKCRVCGEKFVAYGPFMKHMREVHKSKAKMHYRAVVKAERCVVCGDEFPNLHNHYRAHLANQCQACKKYFTSSKLYSQHECDKEDSDPSKVFESNENLVHLINTYIPKDEKDAEKFYGHTDDEDEPEEEEAAAEKAGALVVDAHRKDTIDTCDDESQNSDQPEHFGPISIQSPIISDVLSLYEEKSRRELEADCVIDLVDDDSVGFEGSCHTTVTIDD